ncbi:hypothetical protein B0H11DRAFT_2426167 [Mycena galericulata]|nr:hypothetical protein B0H11DRAFT_2426167 [Mycena galericulata]
MARLLCLSGADVAQVTANFSPSTLQTLMAHVFSLLSSSSSDAEIPKSFTPPRIVIPTQNHTALFMPARIAEPASLRGTSIKVVCVPTSPTDLRGLPASTLVLDEDTRRRQGILNAANLRRLGTPLAHLNLHLGAFPSISTLTIVNRTINERTAKLEERIRARFPSVHSTCLANDPTTPTTDPALLSAVLSANLIICATSSTVPLFPASWVRDGTHIVLVGSYKPTMHEVDGDLIRRAIPSDASARSDLIVDSRAACLEEAGELIAAGIEGSQVVEIGDLVSFDAEGGLIHNLAPQAPAASGSTTGRVTIFKSVGVGLQDVAIACAVVEKAEEMGIGCYVDWA